MLYSWWSYKGCRVLDLLDTQNFSARERAGKLLLLSFWTHFSGLICLVDHLFPSMTIAYTLISLSNGFLLGPQSLQDVFIGDFSL